MEVPLRLAGSVIARQNSSLTPRTAPPSSPQPPDFPLSQGLCSNAGGALGIADLGCSEDGVDSAFASVRLRTSAAKRFRRLDAPHLLRDVFAGRKFEDGKPVSTQRRKAAA